MKLIVLSERTVIDGVIRERGEWVSVDDGFMTNVRRVVNEVDVAAVEQAHAVEVGKVIDETKAREEKEKQAPKHLTIKIDGEGKVTTEPEQAEYAYGDVVVLTAFPTDEKAGAFQNWQIYFPNAKPFTDENNPTKIAMTADVTVVATFGAAGDVKPIEPIETPVEVKPKNGKTK